MYIINFIKILLFNSKDCYADLYNLPFKHFHSCGSDVKTNALVRLRTKDLNNCLNLANNL